MSSIERPDEPDLHRGYLGLLGLVIGLALGGLGLYLIAGSPRFPTPFPSWEVIFLTLRWSSVPYEAIAYVLATVGWLLWAWMIGSLVLRLLLVTADTLTNGAAWLLPVRALSDRLTLPIVRHVVDGALVALVVANLVGRPAPSVWGSPLTPEAVTVVSMSERAAAPASSTPAHERQERGAIEYIVQPGDTLWTIADRFYGTGLEFPRLVDANAGRQMADGRRFTQQGVIYPGWVLVVPLPGQTVEEEDGELYYVVEPGDTLSGIAARFLGTDTRWHDIFGINQGSAQLEGRVLRDPDLIWPGLRIRLPQSAAVEEEPISADGQPATLSPGETAESTGLTVDGQVEATPAPVNTSLADAGEPPASGIMPEPAPVSDDDSPSAAGYGGAAAAAAAAVAAGAFALHRRARRSLAEPPIPAQPAPVMGAFAEAQFARSLTHQLHGHGEDAVTLVAEQACRFMAEEGVDDVGLLTAQQGRDTTILTFRTSLAGQAQLLDLGAPLAARLGGKGLTTLTPDRDVALRITGAKLTSVLAPSRDAGSPRLCLLPLGMLPSSQTLHANWDELGHVLIAGLPGSGSDVVLTTLIAALASQRDPEQLQLLTIAGRTNLPAQLRLLPHQESPLVDPIDNDSVEDALGALRFELDRRMHSAQRGDAEEPAKPGEPQIVLVVGELGDISEAAAMTLDLIGVHGAANGIRLLCATTDPADVADDLLAHFGTRMVLQGVDEAESVRLIGQPTAAELDRGELLVRIDGRTVLRARAFQVSSKDLDSLIGLMGDNYGDRPPNVVENSFGEVAAKTSTPHGLESPESAETPFPAAHEDGGDGSRSAGGSRGEEPRPPDRATDPASTEHPATAGEPDPHADGHQVELPLGPLALAPVPGGTSLGKDTPGRPDGPAAPEDVSVASNPAGSDGAMSQATGPSIQVRCFGEFEVRHADRVITPALETRSTHKSFELLAFLASQSEGLVARDKVLAALWPDSDEEHGAKNMGMALVRLRKVLVGQVPGLSGRIVRADRDGLCRLDTGLVWSDVQEFLALCRSAVRVSPSQTKGVLERAIGLYRGDLFAGQGTRLYPWAEERGETGLSLRETYREEYNRATQRLARILISEGQANQAVPLLRGLLKAEPTLEDVVRDLYRCHGELGDLTALIREDRQLRQALQDAFRDPQDPDDAESYQPEPETVDLFNRIRGELEKRGALQQTRTAS